jgi:hypothetical protein
MLRAMASLAPAGAKATSAADAGATAALFRYAILATARRIT